jgi:1-acyl-sn-glycerol-3-phosphate acyltransferase
MNLRGPVRAGVRLALTGARALEALGRARMADRLATDVDRARQFHRTAMELCALHGISVESSGAIPWRNVLLVSNHLSYVDPLVLGQLLPCVPLAKAEVADWPLLGQGARSLGVLFVNRGDLGSGVLTLRRIARLFQTGISVMNFPEGTTTRGDEVAPFHRGAFGVALRMHVPVLPVGLAYDRPDIAWVGDDLFLPHYVRTAARPAVTAFLKIGQPLLPARFADARALADAAHAEVRRLRAELAR